MAETVQKNLELMAKEMEQFKELKIFNDDELKELLRRRKHFEYKINGVMKNLCDYQDYIKYETALLKMIRIRRVNPKSRCSAERKITIRIKRLYETAIRRFPQNLVVAVDYFMFCKEVKFISEARSLLSTMIKYHPQKEEVWHLASKFYFRDLKDTKTALKTLRKGLAMNKGSKLLFKEIFKVEVLDVVDNKAKAEDDVVTETQALCLKKLEVYLQEIIKHTQDVDIYMGLLDFLKNYKFTLPLQKSIVNYLHNNHSHEISNWNIGISNYDITYKISA